MMNLLSYWLILQVIVASTPSNCMKGIAKCRKACLETLNCSCKRGNHCLQVLDQCSLFQYFCFGVKEFLWHVQNLRSWLEINCCCRLVIVHSICVWFRYTFVKVQLTRNQGNWRKQHNWAHALWNMLVAGQEPPAGHQFCSCILLLSGTPWSSFASLQREVLHRK